MEFIYTKLNGIEDAEQCKLYNLCDSSNQYRYLYYLDEDHTIQQQTQQFVLWLILFAILTKYLEARRQEATDKMMLTEKQLQQQQQQHQLSVGEKHKFIDFVGCQIRGNILRFTNKDFKW